MLRDKRPQPPAPTPRDVWVDAFAEEVQRRLDLFGGNRYARTLAGQQWVQHGTEDPVEAARRWAAAREKR